MKISIYKEFLNKSLEELKDSIEYERLILENIDDDRKQYYMFLEGRYGLYVVTDKLRGNGDSVITCINLYHEDNLVECNNVECNKME
jgi:hypothetical protein